MQRATHSEKEGERKREREREQGGMKKKRKKRGDWKGAPGEACRGREGAMTLSVKYFEEMKKQVNIPEREETTQVNFPSPLWMSGLDIRPNCLTSENSLRLRLPSLPLSSVPSSVALHLSGENDFSVFTLHSGSYSVFTASLGSCLTCAHTHTRLTFDTSQAEQLWSIYSPLPLCLITVIGSNKTLPHWVCPHHSEHKAVSTFRPPLPPPPHRLAPIWCL